METSDSDANHSVLHANTTEEGCDPYRLVILMLSPLLYMHKTTGHVWDQYRLVTLVQKALFCMQKPQVRSLTLRGL